MTLEHALLARADSACELCGATEQLGIHTVAPHTAVCVEHSVLLCSYCLTQLSGAEALNVNHWRCLNDSMWSAVPAVQVLAWQLLHQLREHGWPQDLLDILYLDDATAAWAQSSLPDTAADSPTLHKDSNGASLAAGDTVVLIKDLVVKGANFTAKRGTAVRNISLVADTPEHIEGRINGQQIVILTQFVKKAK